MFTGIIESVGQVRAITKIQGDVRLELAVNTLDMQDVKLGDSIAVNGICLTVIAFDTHMFVADVSAETLRHTALGGWQVGTSVNLEKALLPTTRLGGHIVSGHVDGIGEICAATREARSIVYQIKVPEALVRYMAHKGSVTVDGISLTINEIHDDVIYLNLVPHSAERTTITQWKVGSQVNLEVDVLARYLEKLLLTGRQSAVPTSQIDEAFLAQHGFLNNQ